MNTIIEKDEILQKIIKNFDNEIYLVGGSVRDAFMGIETHDRDLIVADCDAREFSLKVAELFDGTFIPLDEENRIYRIVLPDKINYLDITNPIEGSLEKDLMRRDLTINAIACDIRTGEIIDLSGGISDIKNGIINYVLEENFKDDPLRILRAYRFQAIYGFEISPKTLDAIKKYSDLVLNPAVERINYELLKLFGGKYAHIALENMDKAGILEKFFPFVNELKKVPPNSHHHLDLFHHSLETVREIEEIESGKLKVESGKFLTKLLQKPSNSPFIGEEVVALPSPMGKVSEGRKGDNFQFSTFNFQLPVQSHLHSTDFGGAPRLAHLKLAGFMHDIGKFSTWTIEEGGRHRFIKHDDVGAKMSVKFLKNLHFSNKQIEYISSMIKNHIYPSSVMSAPEISDKIMMRYVRKMENNSIDCIILAMADRLSARGPEITDEMVENNINSLCKLLNFYLSVKDTLKPLPKLLDGNDVMKILNIKPSPKLGEIMSALHEAQISGDVTTKEQAVEFVKSLV